MVRSAAVRATHSRKQFLASPLVHSQKENLVLSVYDRTYDDGSSTESGDDATTVTSWSAPASHEATSSDSEVEQINSNTLPVYSVMMLLSLGSVVAREARSETNSLGYTTQRAPPRSPVTTASPSSWAAARLSVVDTDEAIIRKARSLLNKLTIEKFDSLYEQLVLSGIKTQAHRRGLVREVFEKAATQHHFIAMYADLCMRLESDGRIVADETSVNSRDSFRSLLLDACQTTFEELLESQTSDVEDEEAEAKRKHRSLGNIKFVGQLVVRGMLGSRLLVECAEELLKARDQCSAALESLACLLEVAAPTFDKQTWPHWQQLDAVFDQVQNLSKDRAVPARQRFLLRDVLELREAAWPGRSAATKRSGPMRLEAVRTEIEGETKPAMVSAEAKDWRSPVVVTPAPTGGSRERVPSLLEMVAAAPSPAKVSKADVPLPEVVPTPVVFCPIGFRRALAGVMKELAHGWNVPAAVRQIREQRVPVERQAAEFADIITRAAEESRGPARRSAFAFAAGLAAADGESAFDRAACLEGAGLFFREVYADLCEEVPRLPGIMRAELLPTLRSVLPEDKLRLQVPAELLWTA